MRTGRGSRLIFFVRHGYVRWGSSPDFPPFQARVLDPLAALGFLIAFLPRLIHREWTYARPCCVSRPPSVISEGILHSLFLEHPTFSSLKIIFSSPVTKKKHQLFFCMRFKCKPRSPSEGRIHLMRLDFTVPYLLKRFIPCDITSVFTTVAQVGPVDSLSSWLPPLRTVVTVTQPRSCIHGVPARDISS